MKKTICVILCIAALCVMTGCSKTPELSYTGSDLLYSCTEEEVALFKEDVNVNIGEQQGFVIFDSKSEMTEYTDGPLEFTEENRPDVSKCYFINHGEIENEFTSKTNISYVDPTEGGMKLKLTGTFSYKAVDSKTLIGYYSTMENVHNNINAQIHAVYILNTNSRPYSELTNEKEFSEDKLAALNSITMSKYGIEVTKVNFEVSKAG